ncbi:MAG TPA: cobalamin-dependent protein, partial [Vicinamibacteria bacterium]|nr:cobalamin-dependent protein [Vicinamibacteria bacterium]
MSARLDCVLVSPGNRRRIYQGLADELAAVEPPVWAGLMATYLRAAGRRVEILDAAAEGLGPEEVGRRVAAMQPRLAAVVVYGQQPSASTQVMPGARECGRGIREHAPGTPILMAGGHVAALPERTLEEEPCDFVAGGEGMATISGLLDAMETACPDFRRVPGLHYREAGELRHNPAPPLVLDLDRTLSGVAWDLLPPSRYRAHNWHCLGGLPRAPYAALYTTLGCPYRCTFCCIQAPFRAGEAALGQRANSYRRWTPAHVVEEIARLARDEGVRSFKIADEMFVLDEAHVLAICDGLADLRLDLNLWAYARVDT